MIKNYNDMFYDSRPVKLDEMVCSKYDKIHDALYEDALESYVYDLISKSFKTSHCDLLYKIYERSETKADFKVNVMSSDLFDVIRELGILNDFTPYIITLFFSSNDEKKDIDAGLDYYSSVYKILQDIYMSNHKFTEIKDTEYWKPSKVLIMKAEYPYSRTKVSLDNWWNYYQEFKDSTIDTKMYDEEQVNDPEITSFNFIKGTAHIVSKNLDVEFDVPFKCLHGDEIISDDLSLENTFINGLQ